MVFMYDRLLWQVAHVQETLGDLIMKGDFQAVRKELGPQLKELQSFVQKDGPEAVNRLLSKVKSTKPSAGGGSSDDAAKEN